MGSSPNKSYKPDDKTVSPRELSHVLNLKERKAHGGEHLESPTLIHGGAQTAVLLVDLLGAKTKTFTVVNNSSPATALAAAGHSLQSGPTQDGPWIDKDTTFVNNLAAGSAAEVTFQDSARYWRLLLTPDGANNIQLDIWVHGNNR